MTFLGWKKVDFVHGCRFSLTALLCLLVSGCAGFNPNPLPLDAIVPLRANGQSLSVEDAKAAAEFPDVLAIDNEMRAFVEQYGNREMGRRERLQTLHWALRQPGLFPIQYDPSADGTAVETFHRGRANCLSFAHLFVALAREAGLDAQYHWMDVRPQWTRHGQRLAVTLHVNSLIHINSDNKFIADIDPLQPWELAGSRMLSDSEALAMHHNNLGMNALLNDDLKTAWIHLVHAMELSPRLGFLWVNLGTLYRQTGQLKAAERSYLEALQLDAEEQSAMNNLVVLYDELGHESKKAYWQDRVQKYQASNPFYHAHLGDLASEAGNWAEAKKHYDTAVGLQPDNSALLFAAGSIHLKNGDLNSAERYFASAVENARLARELKIYSGKLEDLRQLQSMRATQYP